jgi:hypothetical protein
LEGERAESWSASRLSSRGHSANLRVDGGGIRGYATLRIIDKIMFEVRVLEKEDNAKLRIAHSLPEVERERDPLTTKNPLPCHYFDYFVGTSTGGYAVSALICPEFSSNPKSGLLRSCSGVFE